MIAKPSGQKCALKVGISHLPALSLTCTQSANICLCLLADTIGEDTILRRWWVSCVRGGGCRLQITDYICHSWARAAPGSQATGCKVIKGHQPRVPGISHSRHRTQAGTGAKVVFQCADPNQVGPGDGCLAARPDVVKDAQLNNPKGPLTCNRRRLILKPSRVGSGTPGDL